MGRGQDHIQLIWADMYSQANTAVYLCVYVCECVDLDNKMCSILISADCVRALIMTAVACENELESER